MVPLMSIWRNFFLGAEPRTGIGPLQWLDAGEAKKIVRRELGEMGIDIRDPDQPVGTLSGGERQSVAIARAVYFGARVLILFDLNGSQQVTDMIAGDGTYLKATYLSGEPAWPDPPRGLSPSGE